LDKVFEVKSHHTQNGKDGPILCILCYDADNKPFIFKIDSADNERIRPRFGILASEVDKIIGDPLVLKTTRAKGDLGEDLVIVWTKWPSDVVKLRDRFSRTFEADVKWNEVAMRELGIVSHLKVKNFNPRLEWLNVDQVEIPADSEKVYAKNRYVVLDIETSTKFVKNSPPVSVEAVKQTPILCIVMVDSFEREYYSFILSGKNASRIEKRKSRIDDKFRPPGVPAEAIVHVTEFTSEKAMLEAAFKWISERYPVAIGGHSICGAMYLTSHKGSQKRMWRNGFDIPMLYFRAKAIGANPGLMSPLGFVEEREKKECVGDERGVDVEIPLITTIDFLKADDFFQFTARAEKYEDEHGVHRLRNKKLGTYLDYYFRVGKVSHAGKEIWELFENNSQEGEYYCWGDVEGSFALYDFFNPVDRVFDYTRTFGIHPSNVFYTQKAQDHLTLLYTHGKFMMPSKYESERLRASITTKLTGALVIDAIPGKHKFVAVFDFSKMYPSVNRAFNIGRNTKVIDLKHELDTSNLVKTTFEGLYYRKDVLSINNEIYRMLIENRKPLDKELSKLKKAGVSSSSIEYQILYGKIMSYKGMTNGRHGNDGNPADRTFDADNYNAVTGICRDILGFIRKTIEGETTIIGGDTDSIFAVLHVNNLEEAIQKAENLATSITQKVRNYIREKYNAYDPDLLTIGCEDISDNFLMVKRKNYIKRIVYRDGAILKKPVIEWKGLRKKKREASDACTDVQGFIGEAILCSEINDDLIKQIKDKIEETKTKSWLYLCPTAPLNLAVDKYSTSYAPIIAVKNAKTILDKNFVVGDRFHWGSFLYHGTGEPIWIAFEDEVDCEKLKKAGFQLDVDKAFEKEVVSFANTILEVVGLSYHAMNISKKRSMGIL